MSILKKSFTLILVISLSLFICNIPTPLIAATNDIDLRIVTIRSNPRNGSVWESEMVTIQNFGDKTVDLSGWQLRSTENERWSLSGLLSSCQQVEFIHNDQRIEGGEDPSTILLIDPDGQIIDAVSYFATSRGQPIVFSQLDTCRLTPSAIEILNEHLAS